ncbi:KxYKxGKxW signal peptide domain-containing protein [Streptococcus equi subsp. zooepidemicus]|uniref:KxYKxGKxW signal peptide domain-containing protein n=1 Tax=Streptococcus equi TaxID=1336 RepID=UPI001E4FDBDB|nr:KxYKxGKxW signal peptide domain-containing protein [Streptococcus equi]MDI5951544.1 KxYKxGKxW signal peptide domain-containing protein [Streptococcus equi subsp. zooepidemicus]MDI6073343.1 KxYKxGKxW signal peptide domain-containing protein [Streptococcus equi subsp. zooepidemicus]
MRKTEGRFRTWKSKKQWLFAGTVVTAGLLVLCTGLSTFVRLRFWVSASWSSR